MVFKFPSEIDPTTLKVIEDRQLQQEQLDRIGLNQSVIETYCGIAGKTDLDVALQLAVNPAAEVARLAAEREKELALGGSGQAVRELADALGGETALRETLRAIEEQPRIDALKILGESTDPMQQLREMAERHRAEQQVLAVPLFDPMEAHRRHEQRKREFDIETARLAEIERQRVIDEAEAARGARSSSTTLAEPVAPKASPKKMKRRDLLTPVIEAAQRECSDPYDAPAVFAVLKTLAESKKKPLIGGVTEDGIQWEDEKGEPQFLSLKNLRERLNRQKKAATQPQKAPLKRVK